MHGNVLRAQRDDLGQAFAEILRRFLRKSGDQVCVHDADARLLRLRERLADLLRTVFPSDQVQRALLHGLRVDGDAPCAGFLNDRQFFRRDRFRPSAFHGELHCAVRDEQIADAVQEQVQLIRLQTGGRTAADVDGFGGMALPVHQLSNGFHLTEQRREIGVRRVPLIRVARKTAVLTACRTERDADVQSDGFRIRAALYRLLAFADPPQQRDLPVRNIIPFFQDLSGIFSPGLQFVIQFARTDACQDTPVQVLSGDLAEERVCPPLAVVIIAACADDELRVGLADVDAERVFGQKHLREFAYVIFMFLVGYGNAIQRDCTSFPSLWS